MKGPTMKSMFAAVPLVLTFLAAAPQDDMRKELAKFEGTWQPYYVEIEGKELKTNVKDDRLVIAGKSFLFTGKEKMEGTITIDPSKKPPTIDTEVTSGEHKGSKMIGIYEISKETLTVCYREAPGDRPTEFTTKENSGRIIVMYKRVK
jgi:uncharacterized protein (TIGR03067 family)